MNQMEQIETGAAPIAELESRKGELKELMSQGLWKNNPSLVQVLGLCPTLAVSSTFTNALGLGLATMAVLVCSNLAVSLVRNWVPKDIRIPVYVMIIASLVTSVQLLMNAYTYGLYQALGIFIALIVTNCIIIGRAEAFASQNKPLPSLVDGLACGLGYSAVLISIAVIREIMGFGTLLGYALPFRDLWWHQWTIMVMPPGAFFMLAIMTWFARAKLVRQETP